MASRTESIRKACDLLGTAMQTAIENDPKIIRSLVQEARELLLDADTGELPDDFGQGIDELDDGEDYSLTYDGPMADRLESIIEVARVGTWLLDEAPNVPDALEFFAGWLRKRRQKEAAK